MHVSLHIHAYVISYLQFRHVCICLGRKKEYLLCTDSQHRSAWHAHEFLLVLSLAVCAFSHVCNGTTEEMLVPTCTCLAHMLAHNQFLHYTHLNLDIYIYIYIYMYIYIL
jgi:hypothetical protein